jgi:hypothetical protein
MEDDRAPAEIDVVIEEVRSMVDVISRFAITVVADL